MDRFQDDHRHLREHHPAADRARPADRPPGRDHARGRHADHGAGPPLLHRLHARRSEVPSFLRVSRHLRLQYARHRGDEQFPHDVRRLGTGRAQLLPAHRLLVREARSGICRDQGLPDEPGRRHRHVDGHHDPVHQLRHLPLRPDLCAYRRRAPAVRLRGLADRRRHSHLHGRHRQERAVPPAHLAA